MADLSSVIAKIPGLAGYEASRQMNRQAEQAELQQGLSLMQILGAVQKQQEFADARKREEQLRGAMAQSGGDVGMALQAALKAGNVQAAHQLAPLVKLEEERKQRESTVKGLADLNSMLGVGGQPQQLGEGQPIAVAGEAQPAVGAPFNREQRIAALQRMSQLYAHNPVVMQRFQSEIDRLHSIKPMVNDYFSVPSKDGEPMVQSHISHDEGRTWSPLAGSVPRPLFSKQVAPSVTVQRPEPPVQTHKDSKGRLWERERGGNWRLATGIDPDDGEFAQPKPITTQQPAGRVVRPLTPYGKLNADLQSGAITEEQFKKEAARMAGVNDVPMTDDTVRMDAFRYLTDGTLPPHMGRGTQGAAQATKVRNEASRIAKEEMGMEMHEVRLLNLTNKAGVAAIAQLGRARAQIMQAEKLANYNADLALEASEQLTRTGVPLLNRGIQWAQENLKGDPLLRNFTIANETFISEYAKVMGGGYGAAAPTEGAQARAHSLLNRAATQEEYRSAITQLKAEMVNRGKSLDNQMTEERGRLRMGVGRSPSGSGGATPKADDFFRK
jgi:hypothetical protein